MAFLIAYSTVPNKRGFQIVGGVKSLENLISGGGVQISGGEGIWKSIFKDEV